MCGIGPYHIRLLCNSGWLGGHSYTPSQVGDMTLDQIFMLLCDQKVLRQSARRRVIRVNAEHAPTRKGGVVSCTAEDGTIIQGSVTGMSLAQRIRARNTSPKKRPPCR
jgi:hypothetical protein